MSPIEPESVAARDELRVRHDEPQAALRLAAFLRQRLAPLPGGGSLVILCIGTDRSTGDALGPLVGQRLHELRPQRAIVLGTLDDPVHATNLEDVLGNLERLYRGLPVIAVDACLGPSENVGSIVVGRGPLRPGAGVNKRLPTVGDLFVTGTVNVGGALEYLVLQNTRLSLVMRMAHIIAEALAAACTAPLALPGQVKADSRASSAGNGRRRVGRVPPTACRPGWEEAAP